MKKILLSLLSIGAVAVVAVAATGAFFSDTETSTGNTFTAGELDLQIDNTTTYYQNDLLVGGFPASWSLKDLVGEKFFNFDDVKPEDYGENTISLHVFDNDAWVCMDIGPLENDDNLCNDPETEAGDNTCGVGEGELAQNLDFFAWLDQGTTPGFGNDTDGTEGDNEWQEGLEPHLFSNEIGPASDVLNGRTYTLADSTFSILGFNGGWNPFVGSTTYYIGVAWCAGTMAVTPNTGDMTGQDDLSCDGSTMLNDTQSDSVVADLIFRAEQWRNNETFDCDTDSPF